MNGKTLLWFLGGAAAVGLVALAFKEAVQDAVRRARDELFEISPGCTEVRWKGGAAVTGNEDAEAKLWKARRYYFEPYFSTWYEEHPGQPPNAAALAVVQDMFPECDVVAIMQEGMSKSSRSRLFHLVVAWATLEAMRGLECDPLFVPPTGMICVERDGKFVLEREAMLS